MAVIKLPDYGPDSAGVNSGFSAEVENLYPAIEGYSSIPSFKKFGEKIKEKIFGAISIQTKDLLSYFFVGTANDIFLLDNTTKEWKKVTNLKKPYSANELAYWSFTVFGDYVVAVNPNDAPQVFNLNKDTNFKDLAGNPPKAREVTVWGDFLVLLSIVDEPNKIMWSGLNDIECWTPGKKNCDFQIFATGGNILGASNSKNPYIFMQRAIYRGIFAPGSKVVFNFAKLYDLADNKSPRAIVARENLSFFLDVSGFYQLDAQGTLTNIGKGRVNEYVIKQVEVGHLLSVLAILDPIATRVYWGLKLNKSKLINKILIYDWSLKKWSSINANLEYIISLYSSGKTLESLDEYGPLEQLPYSLDSFFWKYDYSTFSAIDEEGNLGSFCDKETSMEASIIAGDFKDNNGAMGILKDISIEVDKAEYLVAFGYRNHIKDTIKWTKEYKEEPSINKINKLQRGRYLRIKIRIPKQNTGWKNIKKISYKWIAAGFR